SAPLSPGPLSGRRKTRRRPDASMRVTREMLTEADEGRQGGRRRTSTGAGPPWVRAPVDADVLRGRSAHVLAAVDVERLPGDETRLLAHEERDRHGDVQRRADPGHDLLRDELALALLVEAAAHDVGV